MAEQEGWSTTKEDDFGAFTGTKQRGAADWDLLWTSDCMLSVREDGEQVYRGSCIDPYFFEMLMENLGIL